uniref:Recep_L_domain domain-containing protein n=1 Tax=Panagrellus redivivus TaxID=6233 RepID=A0A7E4UXN7_PANRE
MESVTQDRECQSSDAVISRDADENLIHTTSAPTTITKLCVSIDGADDNILPEIDSLKLDPIILKFQNLVITMNLLETASRQVQSTPKLHRLITRDCTVDQDVTLKTVFTRFPTINTVIGSNIDLNTGSIIELVRLGVRNLIRIEAKGHLEDAHLWGLDYLDVFFRSQYPGFILAIRLVNNPNENAITARMNALLPKTFHHEEFSDSNLTSVLRFNDTVHYVFQPNRL